MLHKVCIYNSKIFIILDTCLIGYYYNKYSESQHGLFKEYVKLKIPIKCSYGNEVSLEVVNNHLTGLMTLVVFLFDFKSLCHVFIYNDSCRKKLYEIFLPIGPVSIEDYGTRLFVSNGPTFLFQSTNTTHLFSLPRRRHDTFDGLLVPSSKEYKILQFKTFGPFRTFSALRFLSLLVMFHDSCGKQSTIKAAGFVSASDNHSAVYELLPLDIFFPRYYETLLKAVEVVKILPYFKTELMSFKDVEWREITSVTCTKDECLVFHNSALLYCCKLTQSILEARYTHTHFSCLSLENTQLVLKLENKTVFFITIKKNTCEVVKDFNDFEVVLTADILGKGSRQVLLLKETDLATWQNNCILFDMLSFLPIDLLCHITMPDECLLTTISGLERKVLIGKSIYQEKEHEISQKSAAIIDALIKLKNFKVNNELMKHSDMFQESLVDLILSKDENKKRDLNTELKPSIKLLEKKQRLTNNHCVLNLLFQNRGEKCICNISHKVLMQEFQVACLQKLFVPSLENVFPSDKYSGQINQRGNFTIQLCFEFSSSIVGDIDLILTWYDGSTDEFENEIFINETKKVLQQHQFSLQTNITFPDVMNSQLKRGISSPSDVSFLRMFQQNTKLCISSLHSSINRLEDLLMCSDSASQNLYFCQSSSSRCIVFSNEVSPLFGVHIIYNSSEKNTLEIEAYAENETQILLMIKYLYEYLPEDVIIFPEINFKEEFSHLKREVANSIKNELDLILTSLSIHSIPEELQKNYSKLLSSQSAGTVNIPKLIYNRIRTALVKKEYITDSLLKNFSYNLSH